MTSGGRFDFDDGGTYCGGWEDGKAHGFGVCTGPKGQGEFAGAWHCGFEISGIYTWTSGNNYKGQWTQGKRHGVGVETKGRWVYQGEWTQGFKGRYGVRQSSATGAKYEGTWTTGLQDGYGVETYADGGTYQGQWLRGIRHGYGVRQSVPYGLAAHCRQKAGRESLTSLRSEQEDDQIVKDRDRKIDENRGGFVLTGTRGDDTQSPTDVKRRAGSADKPRTNLRKTIVDGLKLRKQRSTGDIQDMTSATNKKSGTVTTGGSLRSTISNISHASFGSSQSGAMSMHTDSNASFVSQDDLDDLSLVESYSGEWKNDKRSGFGISERSDGLKYEGEWENNRKHGYGATTFRDGTREEGKYKNNVLISSGKRSKLFILRTSKLKDRVDNAVVAAQRAAQIALQKADIAISRMTIARSKADLAIQASNKAQSDAEKARTKAKEYAPDLFLPHQPAGQDAKKDQPLQAAQSKSSLQMGNHIPTPAAAAPSHDSNVITQNHTSYTTQAPASRSILSRMTRGMSGDAGSETRNLSTIASALVSVGLEGSAHVVRRLTPDNPVNPMELSHHQSTMTSTKQQTPNPDSGPTTAHAHNPGQRETMTSVSVTNRVRQERDRDELTGGGGSHGSPSVDVNRFSQLLTPSIIEDHFDQYKTYNHQDSSSISRVEGMRTFRSSRQLKPVKQETTIDSTDGDGDGEGSLPEFSYERSPSTQRGYNGPNEQSPDSGVSLGEDNGRSRGGGGGGLTLLHRRKTLPVGQTPVTITTSASTPSSRATETGIGHQQQQQQPGPRQNGLCQVSRTPAMAHGSTPGPPPPEQRPTPAAARPTPLHIPAVAMYRSTVRKPTPNMGSMPDVNAAEGGQSVMPREEVHLLSLRRREEIRRQREEDERRRKQEIVLRFGDIKEWCQQRQLLVLVIAVNISLATMFFNLLSQ